MTKFSRQKLVRFWAFRLTHPYQSHYFLSCEIFFHEFFSLELALILFGVTLTHTCMNMIKVLFLISYISQIAYVIINFSLWWTPLSITIFYRLLWTQITNFKPEKQWLYPSHKAIGAFFYENMFSSFMHYLKKTTSWKPFCMYSLTWS